MAEEKRKGILGLGILNIGGDGKGVLSGKGFLSQQTGDTQQLEIGKNIRKRLEEFQKKGILRR